MAEGQALYGVRFREPDERRKREGESRQVDIKQLWQRSHEIINLASLGHKQSEIAEMLGVTPQTVSNTLNSTLGKEEVSEKRKTRDEAYEELYSDVMELTKKAMGIYRGILEAKEDDPKVTIEMKRKVADTVTLELSGMRAPTKIDTRNISTTATMEEIEDFKQRGIQAAKDSGKLVFIDPKKLSAPIDVTPEDPD